MYSHTTLKTRPNGVEGASGAGTGGRCLGAAEWSPRGLGPLSLVQQILPNPFPITKIFSFLPFPSSYFPRTEVTLGEEVPAGRGVFCPVGCGNHGSQRPEHIRNHIVDGTTCGRCSLSDSGVCCISRVGLLASWPVSPP